MMLGIELIGLLQEDGVEREARRLNRRIELLLEALGQAAPEAGGEGEAAESGKSKPPLETKETEEMDDETFAAVKGNPLRPAAEVAATLNAEREPLQHPAQWQNLQPPGSEPQGKRKSPPHPCRTASDLAQRGDLMRSVRLHGLNEFARLEGPEGKAVWIDLWQRAFGIDDCRLSIDDCKTAVGAAPTPAGSAFQSSIDNRQSSILEVAETTWERIQMHLQHREKEAAQVKEVLESCIAARQATVEGIDDCPADETRNSKIENGELKLENGEASFDFRVSNFASRVSSAELAVALLGALGVYKCLGAVLEAGKDIKAAYYRMLVALYGDLPRFEFFKPKAPTLQDHMDDLSSFVLHSFATVKGGPLDQEEQQQIKWRGRWGPQSRGRSGPQSRSGP